MMFYLRKKCLWLTDIFIPDLPYTLSFTVQIMILMIFSAQVFTGDGIFPLSKGTGDGIFPLSKGTGDGIFPLSEGEVFHKFSLKIGSKPKTVF